MALSFLYIVPYVISGSIGSIIVFIVSIEVIVWFFLLYRYILMVYTKRKMC